MNNVILIGFMGSGKTVIGIRLSYRLRRVVEDTDKLIEKKEGMAISDIFAYKGEKAFREMETECIKELLHQKEERIISTGGGLPTNTLNHTILKELGTVFYLKVSPQTVWERLKGDTTRPLLQCDNPKDKIAEMISIRDPLYESACDEVICVDGKSVEQILDEIIEKAIARGCVAKGVLDENTDY